MRRDASEYDPDLLELAWKLMEEHREMLTRAAQYAVKNTGVTTAEAMSELADRLPDILLNYKPKRGASVMTHVVSCAKWYWYKQAKRAPKRQQSKLEQYQEVSGFSGYYTEGSFSELSCRDEIESTLDELHPLYASVLRLRFFADMTVADIAVVLGRGSRSAVGLILKRALEAAQEIVSRKLPVKIKCLLCGSISATSEDEALEAMLDVTCGECGVKARIVQVPVGIEDVLPDKPRAPLAFATCGRDSLGATKTTDAA